MEKGKSFSWKARARSFAYAWHGICALLRCEHNAWIHVSVTVAVLAAGIIFGLSATEWCLISICIGGVLAAEAFNSAIEALADKVSPERDELVGKAKDLAAGAVLLFVCGAVAVGLIIFIPKLMCLLGCAD